MDCMASYRTPRRHHRRPDSWVAGYCSRTCSASFWVEKPAQSRSPSSVRLAAPGPIVVTAPNLKRKPKVVSNSDYWSDFAKPLPHTDQRNALPLRYSAEGTEGERLP